MLNDWQDRCHGIQRLCTNTTIIILPYWQSSSKAKFSVCTNYKEKNTSITQCRNENALKVSETVPVPVFKNCLQRLIVEFFLPFPPYKDDILKRFV
jgi:hypothetical protein